MITAGDILALAIEKPAVGGRMIARADGLVVLVCGAIPGERVTAVVERVGKGVAYATVVDVAERSADRRDVVDPLCGGCLYAHIAYPRQLQLKSLVIADGCARIGRIELPSSLHVASSPEEGYRMRARLHIRGGRVGFFREGTHEICDARQTRQLLTATSEVLDRLVAAMHVADSDGAREIELAENLDASERVVHLDAATPLQPEALERLAIEGLTGLSSPSGSVGDVHVTDVVTVPGAPPVAIRRHVLAFFQGNRYLLKQLVTHVVEQLPVGGEAIDLYAGVGLFAVTAAVARQVHVTAVEGDLVAAADLAVNAATASGAVVPVGQSVEEFLGSGRCVRLQPDRDLVLIVDPPRTGMSRDALNGVMGLRAPRIVYVSCDVATLARDARRLIDAGWAIARLDAFDLFPSTPHVETVVVFDR